MTFRIRAAQYAGLKWVCAFSFFVTFFGTAFFFVFSPAAMTAGAAGE